MLGYNSSLFIENVGMNMFLSLLIIALYMTITTIKALRGRWVRLNYEKTYAFMIGLRKKYTIEPFIRLFI